jgi:CCR4-NOT transcription complex subunit 10
LAPENVGDLSTAPVTTAAGGDDDEAEDVPEVAGQAFTAESAKASLLLNLASAYCMRSDLERAAKALGQVGVLQQGTPAHRQATLLSLYLALSRGDSKAAADIILRNKNSPTRRV